MSIGIALLTVISYLSIASLTQTPLAALAQESQHSRSLDECRPVVIAHRGASGYVPEHTLGAYALAVTMGSDFVEPDLVMTRDGYMIARHENQLDLTTDVAERTEFASRYRTTTIDGRQASGWFSEDFTLAEVKTLHSRELMPIIRPGNTRMNDAFDVPTLQEIINLVKGLEISEQRIIGICPEIKHPTHFQQLGLAMEQPLVNLLHANGYTGPEAPIYIQSFEVSNLRELSNLTDLRLIQLYSGSARQPHDQIQLGTTLTYGQMATAEGLREVATYAYAVGPDRGYIIPRTTDDRLGEVTSFVQDAHAAGLLVHPYTFRAENSFLPAEYRSNDTSISAIGNFNGELIAFLATGLDGIFTDQPDVPARIRGRCSVPLPSSASSVHFHTLLSALLVFLFLLNKYEV